MSDPIAQIHAEADSGLEQAAITPLYAPDEKPMRLAIFMSGTGTNAEKIIEVYLQQRDAGTPSFEPVVIVTDNAQSRAYELARGKYHSRGFTPHFSHESLGLFQRQRAGKPEMEVREAYDQQHADLLKNLAIDAIALAGYAWVITEPLWDGFLTVNVHPGDLRRKSEEGKPLYDGLGWVPSAKAILNGDTEVYTTVHLVTGELDSGPILAVSEPQPVPEEVLALKDRMVLLGKARSLRDVRRFIREHPEISDDALAEQFPIYKHARDCQERLKVNGDWRIFPQAINDIARGRYARDQKGVLYIGGKPLVNGVVMG